MYPVTFIWPIVLLVLVPNPTPEQSPMDPQVSDLDLSSPSQRSQTDQKLPTFPPQSTVEKLILNEKRGNCVPIYIELPADLITPCMAYLRTAKDSKYSFLLESVIAGENVARYSFIGSGKYLVCSPPEDII